MAKRTITLGTLNISDAGKQYVNDALNNSRLSKGKWTDMLEKSFAYTHGCQHGIFCNSGTSALQIALAALRERYNWEDGDEVLVPATTFIATSNVVLQNNLNPVFVDVDPYTFNLNPTEIHRHVTERTRAIIPVHLFGLPADMEKICAEAKHFDLRIIEDSCETMFAGIGKKSVGSFGDLACFSTYVAHLIVGGVGGLVTTNDPQLAEMCRSLMAHGRDSIYTSIDDDDSDDETLRRKMIERRYSFERVGYSYRATELEAALAFSELERWPSNILRRRENAAYLIHLLHDLEFDGRLQLPETPEGYDHSYMMFPMVARDNRDDLLMHLERNGIETRYMFPLLTQPIYRKIFGENLINDYPVSSALGRQGFFIGMHQGLTLEDMDYISEVLHAYFTGHNDKPETR